MTPPTDGPQDSKEADVAPLAGLDGARHVSYLTGMNADAAKAYMAFHSGLRSRGPASRLSA